MDSKQTEIQSIKNIRFFITVVISLLVHIIGIYILVNSSPNKLIGQLKHKKILAYLYHQKAKKTHTNLIPQKTITAKMKVTKNQNKNKEPATKGISMKLDTDTKKAAAQQESTKVITPVEINTAELLNQLAITNTLTVKNNSAATSYREYQQQKQEIPRSKNIYNQLPKPKAQLISIKCDNGFAQGLTVLSGLMGGSIKCEKFTTYQKYIDKRLNKLGH